MCDSQLVAEFYEASVEATSWPKALKRAAEVAGADACGLIRRDFRNGDTRFLAVVGVEAQRAADYAERFGRDDPWLADERLCEATAVFSGAEAVPTAGLVAGAFYRDWLAPADVLHAAFVVLSRKDRVTVLLAAYRRSSRPPFQESELAPLRAMAPRLARAYRFGLDLERERLAHQAATQALDAMPIGVITLDPSGAILVANRFAQAVLAGGEAVLRTEGGLTLDRPGSRLRLADIVSQAQQGRTRGGGAGSGEPQLFSLPRYQHRRALTCLVSLVPGIADHGAAAKPAAISAAASAATVVGPASSAAIVYVGDPERTVRFEPQRIARLYGLSRAESRVAAQIARGLRLEEVADGLGIAYETVRKHLKQIFTKTGVSRQADLVRILVTGPAGLAVATPIIGRDEA